MNQAILVLYVEILGVGDAKKNMRIVVTNRHRICIGNTATLGMGK